MKHQLFINLAVKDLNKTVEFFTKLGFRFNPQFTDENATCMIINDQAFAMLLVENFFQSFTSKKLVDAKQNVETINALSVGSREHVDEMMKIAIDAGATEPRAAQDDGWMYNRSFEDLDGHLWEIVWMDPSKILPLP